MINLEQYHNIISYITLRPINLNILNKCLCIKRDRLTNFVAIKRNSNVVEPGAARSPGGAICAVVTRLNEHVLARSPNRRGGISQLLERVVLICLCSDFIIIKTWLQLCNTNRNKTISHYVVLCHFLSHLHKSQNNCYPPDKYCCELTKN